MSTGTYLIYWKEEDSKVYIGQSINIEYRISQHTSMLKTLKHYNYKLTEMYNLYGIPEYIQLELCNEDKLDDLEILWIDEFNSIDKGLNISAGGISGRGTQHANSVYTRKQILKVFSLLYRTILSYKEVARLANVNIYLVNNIATGNHHLWLKSEYPSKFQKLLDNKKARSKKNVKSLGFLGIEYPPIISPDGQIYTITNISEFCRTHPLLKDGCESTRSSIGKVLKGTKGSYKGWKLLGGK